MTVSGGLSNMIGSQMMHVVILGDIGLHCGTDQWAGSMWSISKRATGDMRRDRSAADNV